MAPAGALLGAVLSFHRSTIEPLVFFLLAALPLLALVRYSIQQERWQKERVDHPEDTGTELSYSAMGLTIVLVSIALGMPNVSMRQITRYARQLLAGPADQSEQVAESLGISRGEWDARVMGDRSIPALPRQHLIGTGPELDQNVVMQVRTNPAPAELARRPYWRSMTFDSYTGDGWTNGDTQTMNYQAAELVSDLPQAPYQIVHQEIRTVATTGGLLHSAGTLITADHDFRVIWRKPQDQGQPGESDLLAATIQASRYQLESWLPNPTARELRMAGNAYPDWIEERYLVLPSPLPSRVLTLTHEFEISAPNPYDRAVAIENYLRTFTYTLDLPPPPTDQDIVDYFLFDLREGYCDYYASAMVVLARSTGLPARLAVGYAGGSAGQDGTSMIITEADAHSWAEIYFPDIGWIEFEPTSGRSAIERPAEAEIAEVPEEWQALQSRGSFPTILSRISRVWWIGLALPLIVVAAWRAWDAWRLRRLDPAGTSEILFIRLVAHGRRLRSSSRTGDTPLEFVSRLLDRVATLAAGKRWSGRMIPILYQARSLVDLHVITQYSAHSPDRSDQLDAIRTWRQLNWRLWLVWIWSLSHRPQKKIPRGSR